jgi:hypothetical protein
MTTIIKTILTGNKRLFRNKAIKRIPSSSQEDKYFSVTKVLSLFFLALLLSGCGSYSNSFDCPIGDGLKCASLSEVNQKIDRGLLNTGFPSEQGDQSCPTCRNATPPAVYWRSDLDQPSADHRMGR